MLDGGGRAGILEGVCLNARSVKGFGAKEAASGEEPYFDFFAAAAARSWRWAKTSSSVAQPW